MTAEERYDIECQIDALYNEAEYCDDHNDASGAIAARHEAEQLRAMLDTAPEAEEEITLNVDPFDVDWDISKVEYKEPIKEDALITEDVCIFRVNFNKRPDDIKDFSSEDEAIKFAKDNFSDEPHVFKKCGDSEPVEIASYLDWNYRTVDEELIADAKELDEASSAMKKSVKTGENTQDLIDGRAIGAVKDPDERARLIAVKKLEKSGKLGDRPTVAQELQRKENQVSANYEKKAPLVAQAICDVEENYSGLPEERTDHLEYVDDNPTDDKFKLPKNITKEEDDHCEKVNTVINHDPDDKDILKEGFSIKATEDEVEGCHISLSGSDFGIIDSDCWVSYAIAKEGIDADLEVYLTGPTVDELDEWFDIDINGDWSHYDDRDVGGTNDWTFDPTNVNAIMYFPRIEDSHGIFKHEFYNRDNGENITAKEVAETLEISEEQLTNITNRCDEMAVSEFENVAADYVEDNVYDYLPDYDEEYWD